MSAALAEPAPSRMALALTVNGRSVRLAAEPRSHLGDVLREALDLTGTHLGCEHGVCGACTVLLDGEPARACLTFAGACAGAATAGCAPAACRRNRIACTMSPMRLRCSSSVWLAVPMVLVAS